MKGDISLRANPDDPRAEQIKVSGLDMAYLNLVSTIVYRQADEVHLTEIAPSGEWADGDGARWKFKTSHAVRSGRIEANVEVSVDEDREVLFLPMLTVFPGEASFGAEKGHALFAGLEYLDNEPSSSELDLRGPQSQRQIPPIHDITFPLMAIQADGRYIGLIWDEPRQFGALFDSPDRIFGSHGHVMGVIWPATDDGARAPGELLPNSPALLRAHQPLRLHASIIAGMGDSLEPAIREYVRLRGLPKGPDAPDAGQYVATAEAGWLDSKIHVGDLYRHAVADGNFAPGPASDAAIYETWLAAREPDATRRALLKETALAALAKVNPASYYFSGPGHIRTPAAALLFGHLPEAINAARADAEAQLGRFDDQGRVIYHPTPGGMDFGQGHFAPDANGYTAQTLIAALEDAAFCGDQQLIDRAVEMLRRQDHFHGTTPRGVQVWELALHTPDIMAAAYLTRAYVDGYELTGDPNLRQEAEHWAWAGVPFVYLRNPTGQPIGPYATIAVYGATHWQAPNWIGLPVQWCGLVYSDALYRLAEETPEPWRQIADGITASGAQQTYPLADHDYSGLLPDSFALNSQHRNPPQINPATLGASAVRLYGDNEICDFRRVSSPPLLNSILTLAPCRIIPRSFSRGRASFLLDAWETEPYYVLINGLRSEPRVTVNGRRLQPESYDPILHQAILRVAGQARVTLEFKHELKHGPELE